jgi:hypothetical protein
MLKVIAFNANDIWRQSYELSKQLQRLHIGVDLFTETSSPMRGPFTGLTALSGRKGENAVRKDVPHNTVHLPPFVPTEATGVCI